MDLFFFVQGYLGLPSSIRPSRVPTFIRGMDTTTQTVYYCFLSFHEGSTAVTWHFRDSVLVITRLGKYTPQYPELNVWLLNAVACQYVQLRK